MWQATYTQGNRGDSRLLVVENQIVNLILDLSFGNNFCFQCPNGSCDPILDIYIPRFFNDLRNFSIQWVLTPTITLWRFGNPLGFQLSRWEFIWECGGSFFHALLHSREHEMWLLGSLLVAPSQTLTLVASPRLRLQQIK
jgi:hypothetical protein